MKARLAWGSVAVAVALVWLLVTTVRVPRIDMISFDQIKEGMTLLEAEEIVGVPPGDYGPESYTSLTYKQFLGGKCQSWINGHVAIHLLFDADGRIVTRVFENQRCAAEDSWISRLGRHLRPVGKVVFAER